MIKPIAGLTSQNSSSLRRRRRSKKLAAEVKQDRFVADIIDLSPEAKLFLSSNDDQQAA